ncbi:hypothetical protein [Mesorhizobium sp.]|uniref:hypothetical protein n=1 Tax=Mesorhizobium sp. TaxID=1871066 RepID=UPI000FE95F9E|nr:hypothetical protein [Mesorhizobium sp.]RWE37474.1 MAG: hypothetical protein EOS77_02525 [Mesorhizobium sp.]
MMWSIAQSLVRDYWPFLLAAVAIAGFVFLAPAGAALAAWQVVRPILTFRVSLPLWAFLVAGGWLYVDKHSAIRTAVDKAVTNMVAGAQIEALEAQLVEERRIRQWSASKADENARIADETQSDLVDMQNKLTLTDIKRKGLADDLAKLKARPAPAKCSVDDFLFDRLRNK